RRHTRFKCDWSSDVCSSDLSRARRLKSPRTLRCAKSISVRTMAEALLTLREVRAGYGDAVVLDDVALELPENGSLAVLGRNGVRSEERRVGKGLRYWNATIQ